MKSHPIMGHNRISQYHMTHDHTTHYQLAPCPTARRREALLHLAAVHDPAQQPALQQALTAVKALPDTVWQGLWLATHGDHIEAAAWVQPLANQTAQLWLPRQLNTGRLFTVREFAGLGTRAAHRPVSCVVAHISHGVGKTANGQWYARTGYAGAL